MPYSTKKRRAATARAQAKAHKRWSAENAVRNAFTRSQLAALSFEITKRVIVIDGERAVREVVFFACDHYRDRRRKLRAVMSFAEKPLDT